MCPKEYADSPKRGSTKENADVWTDTLQVTKDKCVERQEKMNGGAGLQRATKADWSIVKRTQL